MSQTREPICYGQTIARHSVQEWYCTKSGDARRRAKVLRKLGMVVHVEGFGEQVTPVGRIRMTLVSIYGRGDDDLPPVRLELMPLQITPGPWNA